MKQNLFKGALIAAGAMLVSSAAFSQEVYTSNTMSSPPMRTWSFGLNAGVLSPLSPFGGKQDYSNWESKLGYGLYIKKQITNGFSLRADGYAGKLSGDNAKAFNTGTVLNSNFSSFETDVNYTATLNAVFNVVNLNMFKKENSVTLFASAGAGVVGYEARSIGKTPTPNQTVKTEKITIPVGVGAKFRLSDAVNFDLGWTVNFVDADNLDGNAFGSNNDKFNYAYAGLEFNLGRGKQLAFSNPVAETYDQAVAAKMAAESANALTNTLRSDLNSARAENEKLRSDVNNLSMDSDGDGVSDKFDRCPGTPSGVQVDGAGCEIKVTNKVTEKVIITEADRKVVADAISNLEFDLGKSTIRQKSYATLNKVASLLKDKDFSLKLAGHTDNTGSAALNLRLSKDRAEAIKSYLVSQGANGSRIEATGYGEDQPIASNGSASGRQKNRRVEFTLF